MQICSLRVKWIVVANCVSSLNKWNDETKKEFYLRHGIGNSIQDFSIYFLFVSDLMRTSFILLSIVLSVVLAEKYALVFGTKDNWGNYSITSEPCRVYDDLIKAGVKPENIILMMYSTDLNSKSNPWPGMIFTDPASTTDGDWAKYGCFEHIDYTDKDINPKVFLGILTGDKDGVAELTGKENPRVLAAGPEDTVFTYFIDHGNDGIVCVGNGYVHAQELIDAFKTAHEKKLYGKWVWFMEACHSGSMFENKLPEDWNIYIMTSSDSHRNADMSNCPPEDKVAGKSLQTCLSGLWDNAYLDYLESNPDCTIGEIFDAVHDEVAKESSQNVSQWGDMTFRDLKVSEFFGELPSPSFRKARKPVKNTVALDKVPMHLAMWRAIRADKSELAEALKAYQEEAYQAAKKEVEVMRLGRAVLNEKAAEKAMKTTSEVYSSSCMKDLTMALIEKCGHTLPFSESVNNMLRNICLPGLSAPNVDFKDICM